MKDLSDALNGRGKTVDKLQIHLQELLLKLQVNGGWEGGLVVLIASLFVFRWRKRNCSINVNVNSANYVNKKVTFRLNDARFLHFI